MKEYGINLVNLELKMSKTIFFQSSMPRAGSTLFQNILAQNPQIHSTSTSGLSELILENFNSFDNIPNFKKEKDYNLCKKAFYNFCKGGIESYYTTITKKPIIVEKNRLWVSIYPLLNKIYPNPKIIILIRDLRSIFSSFEKYYINNPTSLSSLIFPSNTKSIPISIYDRIQSYEEFDMFKSILTSLQDIIYFKNKSNVHIIKFEDLCNNPNKVLDKTYKYLEIPNFFHNFNYINQVTYENDNFHHFGNHFISPVINPPQPDWDEVLGKEISDMVYEKYNWYFKYFDYKH